MIPLKLNVGKKIKTFFHFPERIKVHRHSQLPHFQCQDYQIQIRVSNSKPESFLSSMMVQMILLHLNFETHIGRVNPLIFFQAF